MFTWVVFILYIITSFICLLSLVVTVYMYSDDVFYIIVISVSSSSSEFSDGIHADFDVFMGGLVLLSSSAFRLPITNTSGITSSLLRERGGKEG